MIEDLHRALSNLEDTRNLITRYRGELVNLVQWDKDTDIRFKILSQLDQCLMTHNITLSITATELMDLRWIKKKLSVTENDTASTILDNYVVNNKNGLIYSVSSVTERYIRVLSNFLIGSAKIEDYRQVRLKVFNSLDISIESDGWKALAILSNIRNTIHNNGMHIDPKNPILRIVYRNQLHIFEHENLHSSATYDNLNHIILDILLLIKTINAKLQILSASTIE